jgi:hypothetical protein
MPEETPVPSSSPHSSPAEKTPAAPQSSGEPASPQPPIPFNIGEEFGTARRNLPSVRIVAIVFGLAVLILGTFAFLDRAKPLGTGSVDNITAAALPEQNLVMVAVNITLRNTGEKPLWVRTIKATLKTDSSEFTDEAASAVDFDRYFQAVPALKEHALPALPPETKVAIGGQAQGTVIFGFPVTQDAFDKRKSLSVAVQPYDQALPVVLTK